MIAFLSYRTKYHNRAEVFISDFEKKSKANCNFLFEINHTADWKENVREKIAKSNIVIFLITQDSYKSTPMKVEYDMAVESNKQIYFIFIDGPIKNWPDYVKGMNVYESDHKFITLFESIQIQRHDLLVEQYKIMVGSAEKVTEQRLKVNNLFFTVTTSILSLSFVLGKELDFSILGALGMLVMTAMGYFVTKSWEKLINSYGKLNTGKFILIDEIEKELKTNIFQREWSILIEKIKYESNTKTECKIVQRFRIFVIIVGLGELIYLAYSLLTYCYC